MKKEQKIIIISFLVLGVAGAILKYYGNLLFILCFALALILLGCSIGLYFAVWSKEKAKKLEEQNKEIEELKKEIEELKNGKN